MKTIAAISVDLETAPLGGRSRLREMLHGKVVLRRTLERVVRAKALHAVYAMTPAAQAGDVATLIDGLDIRLQTHSGVAAPCAELVRACRIWGPDGWRGGIGSLCAFDEDANLPLLAALAELASADAVVSVSAHAAVVDPELIDAMVAHHGKHAEETRLTIVQAPPGLGMVILSRALLAEMASAAQPIGALLTYRPDQPGPDLTGTSACFRPATSVVEARGRLLCDTRRSFDRVSDLLAAGGAEWDATRIAEWLGCRSASHVDEVPEEIEFELTTPPVSDCSVRLASRRKDSRGPLTLEEVKNVARSIEGHDDVRVVLGNCSDPCRYPQFAEVLRVLREAGAAAIAVRTDGLFEGEGPVDAMFDVPVDVIEFRIDAATPDTYRRVRGVDRFHEALRRLEQWIERRMAGRAVRPLIVPSMVKCDETLADMEAFYDAWMRRLGMALITGASRERDALSTVGG